MRRKARQALILFSALLIGLVGASLAMADHAAWRFQVRDHADNVNFLARNVRTELVHVARHSCLFGQMMVEAEILPSGRCKRAKANKNLVE